MLVGECSNVSACVCVFVCVVCVCVLREREKRDGEESDSGMRVKRGGTRRPSNAFRSGFKILGAWRLSYLKDL